LTSALPPPLPQTTALLMERLVQKGRRARRSLSARPCPHFPASTTPGHHPGRHAKWLAGSRSLSPPPPREHPGLCSWQGHDLWTSGTGSLHPLPPACGSLAKSSTTEWHVLGLVCCTSLQSDAALRSWPVSYLSRRYSYTHLTIKLSSLLPVTLALPVIFTWHCNSRLIMCSYIWDVLPSF
jgi:hypothetical protein